MLKLNLQFFGGRGSSGGNAKASAENKAEPKVAEKAVRNPSVTEKASSKATESKQPKNSTGTGKSYKLGRIEESLLAEGNTYTFAHEFLKAFPKEAKREGIDFHRVVNSYRADFEWDKESKTFTFYGKKGKYFFNTKMKLVGSKEW